MVSEWRSVIAVSLNVGGGICLIKPAKLCMCMQKHYKQDEDGRRAPGVCCNGAALSHSENVIMRIGTHTHTFLPILSEYRLNYHMTPHHDLERFPLLAGIRPEC